MRYLKWHYFTGITGNILSHSMWINTRQFTTNWYSVKSTHWPLGEAAVCELVIFKLISRTDVLSISCVNALRWMPYNTLDERSTLAQVMAWCRQATSHYLSKHWPRSMLSYDATKPQWVKLLSCIGWFILGKLWLLMPWSLDHFITRSSAIIMGSCTGTSIFGAFYSRLYHLGQRSEFKCNHFLSLHNLWPG